MTTRFEDKEVGETVTLEFDFSGKAAAVASPVVTVTVASGTDSSPSAILSGSPAVVGAKVFQRVTGGVNGVVYAIECQANNGADVLTIDALLPVINRPLVSDATPRYLSQAQFEQRFGVRELQDLAADGNDYARAENDAAGIVDGYLAARYSLPLVSVPGMVLGWVADIARFRLWDEQAPEEVRRRYEDAIGQLRDLANGKIALPPGTDGTQASAPVDFAGFSATRVFTEETLKDF